MGYPFGSAYDSGDLYDRRRREYLEAMERKKAYEQELKRQHREEILEQLRRQTENSPRTAAPAVPAQPDAAVDNSAQEEAATVIQQAWRRHLAVRRIGSIETQFKNLTSSFSFPSHLDFIHPEDHTILSIPSSSTTGDVSAAAKLAFTKTNVPLHAHVEALSRLLVQLDSVESYGDRQVRERRKAAVRMIEKEAEEIEERWRRVWAAASEATDSGEVEDIRVEDSSSEAYESAPEDFAVISGAQELDTDQL